MPSTKLKRAQRALDKKLSSHQPATPKAGWIRAVRDALGMTGQQLASRLGVTWSSMDNLEKSEAAGTITLNSLTKAAAAMDCRLVYALVPNAASIEALVDQQARQVALAALGRANQTMLLEAQAVGAEELEQRIQDYITDHIRDSELWAVKR
ncbi:MAG: mobile mystery protein A [Hyphomicrobiales bacterium]|nr:MAG: mobile mystery protein A [Hyphomicrobiales bacterium]